MLIKLLISILIIVYFAIIAEKALAFIEVCICLRKLNLFISAYAKKGSSFWSNRNVYAKSLDALLKYSPVIRKYYDHHSLFLSRKYSDGLNHEAAQELYVEFLDIADIKRYELKCSFNPFIALKAILLFPATALSWFGIRLKEISSIFISIISYIIMAILECILKLYSDKIEIFIETIIHLLFR